MESGSALWGMVEKDLFHKLLNIALHTASHHSCTLTSGKYNNNDKGLNRYIT
jgi:hypothetical protein